MQTDISKLRVLLLSIRDETATRQEEHRSFALYSGLALEQIDVLNVFTTPEFLPKVVVDYDALFIGGASEASVLEPDTYPFVDASQRLIKFCIDQSIPVFASCFGFQLAVLALNGEIKRDKTNFEMGTLPISLTQESMSDPLFHDTPDGFLAVSVHQEKAEVVPEGCDLIARTEECVHVFRVKNKPFWAFQFHPEVDRATLVSRLTIFKDRYTEDEQHLSEVLDAARETPESNVLVRKFVERVLLAPDAGRTAGP
jgi:GMP synthase (glutamine-hydrolysing)